MSRSNQIEIVHSTKLDKNKWDDCVRANPGGLIYSLSWFLDQMADDWYGLIVGDYRAVMALPVKAKFGFRIVTTPAFAQRLGLAGNYDDGIKKLAAEEVLKFCKAVQYASSDTELFSDTEVKRRTNFVLDLRGTYESILDSYTPQCRKNISKSASRGCVIAEDVSIDDVFNLYRQAYGARAAYSDEQFDRLRKLVQDAVDRRACHIAGVRDASGTLVYAGALLDDGKRLYYILGAPTEHGRQMRATYFFIDHVLKRFAGSGKLFDFEGSDLPNVAKFYQSFSPDTEYYYQFYINKYPFPFNKMLDLKLKAD